MRVKRLGATAGVTIAVAAAVTTPAAASTTVSGRWVIPVPCLGISVPLSDGWGGFHCGGSSRWLGTWAGSTAYTADGAVNVRTGDAHGTVLETFRGRTPDGRSGTLRLHERFVVNGTTHRVRRVFELVEGGGDFARMRGSGSFDGVVAGPVATGAYAGKWWRSRPHRGRSPSHRHG